MYNDHPWDPKIVAVIDRWSLFRGHFWYESSNGTTQNGGRCWQVVAIRRWSLPHWFDCTQFFICCKPALSKPFATCHMWRMTVRMWRMELFPINEILAFFDKMAELSSVWQAKLSQEVYFLMNLVSYVVIK